MTDPIIERAARALWDQWCLWAAPIREPKPSWDDLAPGNKDIGRRMARVVLAAIREPSEGMVDAGGKASNTEIGSYEDATNVWRAMIDKALEQEPKQ